MTERRQQPPRSFARGGAHVLSDSPALRVFCERWGAADPDAAMTTAMAHLRQRAAQVHPPVGLESVLTLLDARVVRSSMSPRGRLQVSKQGWVIHVPPDATWRAARFTIAHEIGHILTYDAVSGRRDLIRELRYDADLWSPVEGLCDRGAAELLVPAADLSVELSSGLPRTRSAALTLYDRYMVSPTAFMRRLCDLGERRSATVWRYESHGAKRADWRVAEVYSKLPKRSYIPKHLSAQSHLSPNLIQEAAETGYAYVSQGTLTAGGLRHTGDMLAFNPTVRRTDEVLPVFGGLVVPDSYTATVHLLIDHVSVGPTSRRTRYR